MCKIVNLFADFIFQGSGLLINTTYIVFLAFEPIVPILIQLVTFSLRVHFILYVTTYVRIPTWSGPYTDCYISDLALFLAFLKIVLIFSKSVFKMTSQHSVPALNSKKEIITIKPNSLSVVSVGDISSSFSITFCERSVITKRY